MVPQRFRLGFGLRQLESLRGARLGERSRKLLFALGPKAAQLPQPARSHCTPQILKRTNVELVIEQLDAFWT